MKTNKIVTLSNSLNPKSTLFGAVLGITLTLFASFVFNELRPVNECLNFRPETIETVPFHQFQRDITRFKNMIADSVTVGLQKNMKNNQIEASVQCTFTFNRLKNFIHLIESNVPNDVKKDELALTWNYAVYSSQMTSPNYARLQSLYGVPALLVNGLPTPITINGEPYSNLIQSTLDTLQTLFPEGPTKEDIDSAFLAQDINVLMSGSATNQPEAMNHGQLCPPPPCEPSALSMLQSSYSRHSDANYSN